MSSIAPRLIDLDGIDAPAAGSLPGNVMTVDVEDYFQVSAFEPYVDRDAWSQLECRLPRTMERILQLFAEADVRGTFFCLGWVAEKYPELIRRVADQGHEIASHGYRHVRVYDQSESEFREDVGKTKALLEDLIGKPVNGYRAASYSIDDRTPWAFDVLWDSGYRYSSSIYPIRHDHYGMRDAPRFAFHPVRNALTEIPVTTVELSRFRFPCGGGGYFRLFPYAWSRWCIRRVNEVDHRPAMFYFHPWELDPDQPRMDGLNARTRFRHYVNLHRFERKLRRLIGDFRWVTMMDLYEGYLGADV